MKRADFSRRIRSFLMAIPRLIAALLEQASAQGSRSTVLRPLGWLLSICIVGSLGAAEMKAPAWFGFILGWGVGLSVLVYLLAYGYCLMKCPDALRSERYSINKMVIEKGFVGDSLSGTLTHEAAVGRLMGLSVGQLAAPEDEK